MAIRGVPIAALAIAAVSATGPAASAQETSLQDALDSAADEFVAEKYSAAEPFISRVREGQVLPPCGGLSFPFDDPELPDGERAAIALAVDAAYVRAALREAGIAGEEARAIASHYAASRIAFEAATKEERAALIAAGEDPAHRLLKLAAALPRTGQAAPLQPPEDCDAQVLAGSIAAAAILAALGMEGNSGVRGYRIGAPHRYRFVTEPPDANVFLMPRFSFRVCEKRFANPYSRSDCTAWRKVPSGTSASLNGMFEYSIEWPDGTHERERANFESRGSGVEDVRIVKPAR